MAGSLEMVKAINNISDVAKQNEQATLEVRTVTADQRRSMEEMATSALEMSNLSLELERVVSRFRLGGTVPPTNGASTTPGNNPGSSTSLAPITSGTPRRTATTLPPS